MYSVDRRLEPQQVFLWERTREYGVVTGSFAKPARPTTIAWETEEKFRIQHRYGTEYFIRGLHECHTRVTCSTYCAAGS
jgi:hypothetical protein